MKSSKKKIDKKRKKVKGKKPLTKLRKFIYLVIALMVIGVVFFYGTKIYLILYLWIGNDSLVGLTASNQDLFLNNSEMDEVKFNMYVSTNPFCKSICDYSFTDLSTGEVLDRGSFDSVIVNPHKREYVLQAPNEGAGQNLYRFWVSCLSKESTLCKTAERPIQKSFLVALNYGLSDYQLALRLEAIDKLDLLIGEYAQLKNLLLENEYLYDILSNNTFTQGLGENNLPIIEFQIEDSLKSFKSYNYDEILSDVINVSDISIEGDNARLKSEVNKYNNFVSLLGDERALLESVLVKTMSTNDVVNVTIFVKDHNNFISILDSRFDVDNETIELNGLIDKLEQIDSELNESGLVSHSFQNVSFSDLELIDVNFTADYESNFSIPVEEGVCFLNETKGACCDASCSDDVDKYPIILLHGHSFNSAISAEKSLGDLKDIQEKLVSEGFVDGGDLILRSESVSDAFKKTRGQVVFSASYYFDIYKNTEETVVLETQSDNLNTYTLRLNEMIEEVKLKTGKDKVIIVAHSMGGLVSRRYLQIFGEDDVEELIMIGVPNKGIDGFALSTCSIFGSDKHCEDLDSDSLFINKLTYGGIPEIPVENIIGIGCDTQDEAGDGVVKNSSAYLPWANNYYVNGTCEGFDYLHTKMLQLDKSPDAFELVKSFLVPNIVTS